MKIAKCKRLLTILVLAVITVNMLAGCGKKEEKELRIIDDNYRNYYEIFVYSFYDSDGDGIGDLRGVAEKLDYIKDMGFQGIWLTPIFQSTTYHKYDVVDYLSIDSEFGTMEDFDYLIEECHKRDIRVVLDFVINHTSAQHPWFKEASKYYRSLEEGEEPDFAECKYAEYYNISSQKSSTYQYTVLGSNWFYEGGFWSEMPDLNLQSKALREELQEIAKFWIDKGVDGFRMDAAMHYEENDAEANCEILNWLYDYCKEYDPDFYMVSEVWANKNTFAKYYASNTPSIFNFDVADNEGKIVKTARGTTTAAKFVQSMAEYEMLFHEYSSTVIDAPFITNHDTGRLANALRNDENDMKMACALLMTMNGSPFVYYGEEIGMASSGTKDENKRIPMLWTKKPSEGTTIGPLNADSGITSHFESVEQQIKNPKSLLNFYKKALRLRNENPEIARGTIQMIDQLCDGNQAVITKTYENSTIAIAYNTSDEKITISLEGSELQAMNLYGELSVSGKAVKQNGTTLILPPQSVCILR